MSSVLYLGVPPKASQTVPQALADKGIQLVPVPPSKINTTVTNEDHQPNHDLFVANLPAFAEAAATKISVKISKRWRPLSTTHLPSYAKTPTICWSYPTRVSSDFVNGLRGSIPYVQETVIKGKTAFMAPLAITSVPGVLQDGASSTTPGNLSAINIAAYRAWLMAHRIIDGILRTNQYAYKASKNSAEIEGFDSRIFVMSKKLKIEAEDLSAKKDGSAVYENLLLRSSDYRAKCNVAIEPASFVTTVVTKDGLPADHDGLLIPFEVELAQPDYSTIAKFFDTYCVGFFGHDEQSAVDLFSGFKQGIGGLTGTKWGDELSHICWSLDLALRCQATMRVWVDSSSNYMGCIILGSGFTIHHLDRSIQAADAATLANDISQSTPHQRAMNAILNSLFTDPMDLSAAMQAITNTHDLRRVALQVGLNESRITVIKSQLRNISFPGQVPYLLPTGDNIWRVLSQLTLLDTSNDHTFPLHPSYILNNDRAGRLWSAFGVLAPSFLVPGGKSMNLASSFEVREKNAQGEKETRTVTKIGIIQKSLDQAVADLDSVKMNRIIHNPHGSQVMNRVSSDSIIRSFEKDQASKVIGILRVFAGVSAVNTAPSVSKRKRDDDEETANASKRARLAEF